MAKTPYYAKAMHDMMSNSQIDTSSMQNAMKSQSLLAEKLARVALTAAERSTEISARWVQDSISRMGELAAVKEEPSEYAKAMSDFASAAAETAAEHLAAYAEVAKNVQTDTVNLILTAGKVPASDAQKAGERAKHDPQDIDGKTPTGAASK